MIRSNDLLTSLVLLAPLTFLACGKNDSSDSRVPTAAPPSGQTANGEAAVTPPAAPPSPAQPVNPGAPSQDQTTPPGRQLPPNFSSWDQLDTVDPENASSLRFRGSDPALALLGLDDACTLYLMGEGTDEAGNPVLIFRTSYRHLEATHPHLSVRKDQLVAPGTAIKRSDGLAEMFLKLRTSGDLSSVYAFNLKWFHINHYDTGTCEDLRLEANP